MNGTPAPAFNKMPVSEGDLAEAQVYYEACVQALGRPPSVHDVRSYLGQRHRWLKVVEHLVP